MAAPELRELIVRVVAELIARSEDEDATQSDAWDEWIQATPERLEAASEIFRRVSTGEV